MGICSVQEQTIGSADVVTHVDFGKISVQKNRQPKPNRLFFVCIYSGEDYFHLRLSITKPLSINIASECRTMLSLSPLVWLDAEALFRIALPNSYAILVILSEKSPVSISDRMWMRGFSFIPKDSGFAGTVPWAFFD